MEERNDEIKRRIKRHRKKSGHQNEEGRNVGKKD
jgi:hypothetical protein